MGSSNPIDYSLFYQFSDPLATQPLRLSIQGYSDWITSQQSFDLFTGDLIPSKPIKLGGYQGKRITDILWSSMTPIVCVSSHIVELLVTHNISGWSTYPVELFDLNGSRLPEYHGFVITGPECRRDKTRSEVITKPAPTPTGKPFQVYKGVFFEEEDWDGSDFFFVRKGIRVASHNVKRIFAQAKIINIRMVPLTEVERRVSLDRFEKD
jgi:hypothetical protein